MIWSLEQRGYLQSIRIKIVKTNAGILQRHEYVRPGFINNKIDGWPINTLDEFLKHLESNELLIIN